MAIEKQLEELSTQIAELIVAVRALEQRLTPANAAAGPGRIIEPPPRPAAGTQGVLVTVTEAAEILSCSPAAVRAWIRRRKLPSVKVGRLVRLRRDELDRVAVQGLPEHRIAPRGGGRR